MSLRKIITDDLNFLRKKSKPIVEFDDKLSILLDDMIETLHATKNAVGLAAVQIGVLKCAVVIDVGEGVIELVNPKIVEKKGEQNEIEGCLSFPGVQKRVKRPSFVVVEAFNRKGEKITVKGEGLLARALCHEVDHLNGIVFLDRAE